MKAWNLETGLELFTLEDHPEQVNTVALSADGRLAVSGCDDWTMRVWDIENGRLIRTLEGHSDAISRVALRSDGAALASVSWDKSLKVWDLKTGTPLATFTCDSPALCCAFYGKHRVIVGDMAGRVHFLSLEL